MASSDARLRPSHPDKIRMLVLETDDADPTTKRRHGSFGDVLDTLFKEAGDRHDPSLGIETVIRYVVEEEEGKEGKGGQVPSLKEVDELDVKAILLTGSTYDAHGDNAWIVKLLELLKEIWLHRPEIRLSGICFGHQLLCRLLGSQVTSTPGETWELSHTRIALTPLGRRLFDTSSDHIHLHQMHVDHVADPPSPAIAPSLLDSETQVHVWGRSELTHVQGVYIRRRLFTSQGHLGFDEEMVRAQVRQRVESGAIDDRDGQVAEAMDRAEWEHDGVLVAGAVLRFFHGDDDEF